MERKVLKCLLVYHERSKQIKIINFSHYVKYRFVYKNILHYRRKQFTLYITYLMLVSLSQPIRKSFESILFIVNFV
jgi:hypothetical protein